MSALIVGKEHIDLLVSAGLAFTHHGSGVRWNASSSPNRVDYRPRYLAETNPHADDKKISADEVGSMLWAENLSSVAYRYPNDVSGERPGPIGFEDSWVLLYRFKRIPGTIRALTVLSALDTYEYQSCEHSGWDTSEAKRYCDALRRTAIKWLPGYDTEPGSFGDRNYFTARSTHND